MLGSARPQNQENTIWIAETLMINQHTETCLSGLLYETKISINCKHSNAEKKNTTMNNEYQERQTAERHSLLAARSLCHQLHRHFKVSDGNKTERIMACTKKMITPLLQSDPRMQSASTPLYFTLSLSALRHKQICKLSKKEWKVKTT